MSKLITICISLFLSFLVSCSAGNDTTVSTDDSERALAINNPQLFYGQEVSGSEEKQLLQQATLYFAYDSYEVKSDDLLVVYAHARNLIKNPKLSIILEGHTDERGSSEYNIGLGERRAKSVLEILLMKGVEPHQITLVSYGKEKPKQSGDTEAVFAANRRVELIYK